MRIPFTDGFYISDSDALMRQELINIYVHRVELSTGEVLEEGLWSTPGALKLDERSSVRDDSTRGAHLFREEAYFVNSNGLQRLNIDETVDEVIPAGTFSGDGPVSMAANDTQLMILIPGGDGFIFTRSPDAFTVITDTDFKASGNPQTVIFIDGFFWVTTDTKKFITSEINDGLNWNALDFGTAESDPDPIVAGFNFRSQGINFGSRTTEFFDNVGGSGFVFVRNGLILNKGLFARFSVVEIGSTFMFIGGGGGGERATIWRFENNDYVKTSTGAIDKILQGLSVDVLEKITSYSYSDNNNNFACWVMPDQTICYDITTGKWHIRRSTRIDESGNIGGPIGWKPTFIIKAYNNLYAGDRLEGKIYKISRDFVDEDGINIQRTFDTRPIRNGTKSFSMPRIEVTVQSGRGDANTPDPLMGMAISRNGSTFKDIRNRPIGKVGEFNQRSVWRLNGRFSRYAICRFTYSEKTEFNVISIDADIVGGR